MADQGPQQDQTPAQARVGQSEDYDASIKQQQQQQQKEEEEKEASDLQRQLQQSLPSGPGLGSSSESGSAPASSSVPVIHQQQSTAATATAEATGHGQSQGPMQAPSPQQQQQQQYGVPQQHQQHQQHAQHHQQQPPPPPQINHHHQHQQQQQQQQQLPLHHHSQPQQHHAPPQQSAHGQSPAANSQSHYDAQHQSHYASQPPPPPQQQQQQQPQVKYDLSLPPPPPQPQAPTAPQQANGAPPGYAPAQQIPPPHHNSYQYQQPQYQQPPPPQQPQPVNGDANGFPSQMRYQMPLPPNQLTQQQQQQQQLAGTKHRKEIKRRTKTGCLTCRKRRIKCDEGHPSCRNCQKSKRECLGYDPIFKAQTGQPANIQPQPGSVPPPPTSHSPHAHVHAHTHAPPPLQHTQHAQYSNVPQGYVPASSAGYAPGTVMQNQLDVAFDYGSAIDPALAVAHPAAAHQQPPPPMPPPQEEYSTILLPERRVRSITMNHVYSLDGVEPTFPPPRDDHAPPPPQQEMDAIRELYFDYAAALDRFFETDWYTNYGWPVLLSDPDLVHYFSHSLSRFHSPPSETNNPKALPSIEARLIWQLASLAYSPSTNSQPPPSFLPRVEAVSHLILGSFMPQNHVPPAPTIQPDPKNQPDAYAFYLQELFWHHLISFTTIHDDHPNSPTSAQDIANQLAGMRNILSMLENRDVLYSMAITRHFGGRMEEYYPEKLLVGRGGEAEDPINKLVVAMGFLINEEGAGTTQVVQRLCGMSRRGFLLQRPEQANQQRPDFKHNASFGNGGGDMKHHDGNFTDVDAQGGAGEQQTADHQLPIQQQQQQNHQQQSQPVKQESESSSQIPQA